MAILELRGLKVLPPSDLDDGESLWIGPGAVQPRQCTTMPLVAGSSGKIPNGVSREAQDNHQAIHHRSDSTKIK